MQQIFESLSNWAKSILLILVYALVFLGMSSLARATETSVSQGSFILGETTYARHLLRTGIYLEQGKMKGCVLYLQGLGDSMLNHEPLFRALSDAGYRTVTFDYYGQGGSSGSMNETRLLAGRLDAKSSEIRTQAKAMWKYFSTEPDPVRGLTCAGSRRLVIGWSTGGLAGYTLAIERWAQGVVLIAPGLFPKKMVGEAGHNWFKLLAPVKVNLETDSLPQVSLKTIITLRTLTRARYASGHDPHVEMPKPNSPLKVPLFSLSLLSSAKAARRVSIDPSVKGLVLLSGYEDTYVDSAKTRRMLKQKTRFDVHTYPGALHELDNEISDVRLDLVQRTIGFLNSVP